MSKNKLASIKLVLTFLFTALFTYLLKTGGVTSDNYVSLMTIIILSYFGANAASKFTKPKE